MSPFHAAQHIKFRRCLPYVFAFLAASYLWWLTTQIDGSFSRNRLGPDAWPRLVLAVMLAAALIGVVQAAFGAARNRSLAERLTGDDHEAGAVAGEVEKGGTWRVAAGLAGFATFPLLSPLLGFTVTATIVLFAQMWIGGYRRLLMTALIAVVGALALAFIFQRLVYLSLPLGAGPFATLSTTLMAAMGVR